MLAALANVPIVKVYIDGPHKILGKRAKLIIAPPFRLDPPISGLDSDYFVTRRMSDESKTNVYQWLGYDPEAMYRWHEHYNEATFQIAKMTDTPIIDITSSLDRCVGGKEQYYCEDGIHPNAEGHRFIASQYYCSFPPTHLSRDDVMSMIGVPVILAI